MNTSTGDKQKETFHEIDVAAIESELASHWNDAGSPRSDDELQEPSVIRACTLNLIVYVPANEDLGAISVLLDELNDQHPGRTVIVIAEPDSDKSLLDSKVSIRCHDLSDGRREICGERVTLRASGKAVDTSFSAVAQLLVPDVPVFLWWKEKTDFSNHVLQQLASISDRIIVDSDNFQQRGRDLVALAKFIDASEYDFRLTDMNWTRLTAWRMMIAGFWDIPEYREYLDRIDRVAITFQPEDDANDPVEGKPILFAGWLASRLGWIPSDARVSHTNCQFRFRAGDRPIDLTIDQAKRNVACAGMITSVSLVASDQSAVFDFSLGTDAKTLSTQSKIGDKTAVGRTLVYEPRSESLRLSNELSLIARDIIFEASLSASANILELV